MNKICWNNTTALKFLTLLKSYPIIWNKNSVYFKNQFERNECWKKMSEELGLPTYLLKLKYRSLVYSFQVEYKKTLKCKDYKPNLKFYSQLSFLADGFNKAEEVAEDALDEISDEDGSTDVTECVDVKVSREQNTLWTDRKIAKFIKILEKCPLLRIVDFHRRDIDIKRNELWKKVSNKLEIEVDFLQQERKRLVRIFRDEYNKIIKNPGFKSKSKYFPQLMFFANKEELLAMQAANKKTNEVNGKVTEVLEATAALDEQNDYLIYNEGGTILPKFLTQRKLSDFKNVSFIKYWNYDNTIQFINLIRESRPIWDESFLGYEFNAVKEKAWEEISKEMNVPVDVLKDRFKTLTSLYRTERRLIAQNPNHVIAYIYFPNLEFLPIPKVMQEATLTHQNFTTSNIVAIDLEKETNLNSNKNINYADVDVFQNNCITTEVLIDENNEKLTTNKQVPQQRDEHTIFGENVANEMRQMSDYKHIQLNFKAKVLSAIYEANQAAQKLGL